MITPVNVFTTFSASGYEVYGERWLNSMLDKWKNINITIYTDFDLQVNEPNVTIYNFDKIFPEHKNFQNKITKYFDSIPPKGPVIGRKTNKFSFKAFCIANELMTNKDGITVWTDADTQCIDLVDIDYNELLQDKFCACQVEKAGNRNPHIESGILFFDSRKQVSQDFGKLLYDFYNSDKIFSIKKPYDGYVIAKILYSNNLDFVDLNQNYNVDGKRSDKDATFLHPILKKHFVHWIGNIKS